MIVPEDSAEPCRVGKGGGPDITLDAGLEGTFADGLRCGKRGGAEVPFGTLTLEFDGRLGKMGFALRIGVDMSSFISIKDGP